jgi:hypothetical protein
MMEVPDMAAVPLEGWVIAVIVNDLPWSFSNGRKVRVSLTSVEM